jgi:hypothetical protein
MVPTRSGKRSLTTIGISTLTTAIPARASPLSSTNTVVPGANGRAARPSVSTHNPAAITAPVPNRRARRGAANPTEAKQTTGSEVSRPATVAFMPTPVRISASTGPTLVTASRRLTAASTTAATAKSRPDRRTRCSSRVTTRPSWALRRGDACGCVRPHRPGGRDGSGPVRARSAGRSSEQCGGERGERTPVLRGG